MTFIACRGVQTVATLTIRRLDEGTKSRLRVRAAENGRSMEEEARVILDERLAESHEPGGLGSRMHARVADLGGVDLDLPPRGEEPRAANFSR